MVTWRSVVTDTGIGLELFLPVQATVPRPENTFNVVVDLYLFMLILYHTLLMVMHTKGSIYFSYNMSSSKGRDQWPLFPTVR